MISTQVGKRRLNVFSLVLSGISSLMSFAAFPLIYLLKLFGLRVLDVKYEALGHLAMEPDIFLRLKELNGGGGGVVILFPHWGRMRIRERLNEIKAGCLFKKQEASYSLSNRYLLHCWRRHFLVIDNLFLFFLLYPILSSKELKIDPYGPKSVVVPFVGGYDCRVKNLHKIYRESQKVHQKFLPILTFKDSDRFKGREILQHLGIPEGSWFVCFSARAPGYYPGGLPFTRNSSIINLEKSLIEITRRGGYCIRMGSAKTENLPAHWNKYSQIIDYSHSDQASDFMDVYLAANCRFSIGPMSGINELPRVFGTPCVMVNTVPFGLFSPSSNCLNIFKLQFCKRTNRLITFSECLKSYLSGAVADEVYDEFQVGLIENSEEEIYEAVVEMLDRIDNKIVYSNEDDLLQSQFQSQMNIFNYSNPPISRIGRLFLKRYKQLLV